MRLLQHQLNQPRIWPLTLTASNFSFASPYVMSPPIYKGLLRFVWLIYVTFLLVKITMLSEGEIVSSATSSSFFTGE